MYNPGALIIAILSGRILSPLVQAGQLLTKMNHALAAFIKIDELMKTESRDNKTEGYKATDLVNGEIIIKNVNFEIDETPILKDINMTIQDGEKIGIVGNIGSGKRQC